jgi:DNA-binding LacI/PurR family transcriptional regulator|tara:strand:+ start:2571 stop:3656 length:1086 start_codon:yes stop_codon:yes gene_type:complete
MFAMSEQHFLSIAEQVAAYLRKEIISGHWSGVMPGKNHLAEKLGINKKTVVIAMNQLEREGLLEGQGSGRSRKILLTPGKKTEASMKIAFLGYNEQDQKQDYMIHLQHRLAKAGHHAFYHPQPLTTLGMKVSRIRKMVKSTEADAWLVGAGSIEVLKWFSEQPAPAFALFGRMNGLPIAGTKPDKATPLADATRQLIALGHRRISLLAQTARRLPEPGHSERVFLKELESHGIQTSTYNLPDWDDSTEGLNQALDALFKATPPTALILDEAPLLIAAQLFLLNRGLRVPQDVSLISTDNDPHFSWCTPSIAHIHWDNRPVVRRVVNWASNISRGKKDIRQKLTPAEFIAGGTIGPVAGNVK